MRDNLVLLNSDGTYPTTLLATSQGQFPKIGVTTGHRLQVEAKIVEGAAADAAVAALTSGTKTVAATGTPEALVGVSTKVRGVVIVPLRTNTSKVYLSTSSTNDAQHIEPPFIIEAPDGDVIDLAGIYIDVVTNGEGVAYVSIV